MYDADEQPEEKPAYDWDAWERNRLKGGYTRWWLIMMAVMTLVLTIQFFANDGKMFGS
ncbi:MAG TPA: hypothetical protein VNS19_23645 [Acidimicrobiales bacterium]|nr:hypothetical protein [Acidimicrobiales bacterium]